MMVAVWQATASMAPSAAAKGKGKARATHGDNDDGIDDVIRTAVRRIPQPVPTHVMAKSRGPVKEASFDRSKRREFLTGFHKRKKAKHDARVEKAKLREREERSELRRYVRPFSFARPAALVSSSPLTRWHSFESRRKSRRARTSRQRGQSTEVRAAATSSAALQ